VGNITEVGQSQRDNTGNETQKFVVTALAVAIPQPRLKSLLQTYFHRSVTVPMGQQRE
jgi:hypothetical protein